MNKSLDEPSIHDAQDRWAFPTADRTASIQFAPKSRRRPHAQVLPYC